MVFLAFLPGLAPEPWLCGNRIPVRGGRAEFGYAGFPGLRAQLGHSQCTQDWLCSDILTSSDATLTAVRPSPFSFPLEIGTHSEKTIILVILQLCTKSWSLVFQGGTQI